VVAPSQPELSGSPQSLIPWDTLGRESRTAVAGATTVDELRSFAGPEEEVLQPIRVYVGLESAGSVEERVELAIREPERTRADEREILAVVTVTATWIGRPGRRRDGRVHCTVEYIALQ
jgi:uncharacterized membrane protein